MRKTLRILVKGRVQGVWFRKFTQSRAAELNIDGWVRNLPSGAVEVAASGEEANMKEFISAVKVGPTAAKVEEVEVVESEREQFDGFRIIR